VAQELAAREFTAAPKILGTIMKNESNNPRHRIDAAQALGRAAVDPASENKAERQVFTINLNFGGGNKINKEIELKPHAPEKTDWELNDG
jgi:hypothetical protein